VDKGQIGQVLNNLIINADQAMPVGGVIRVEADNFTVKEEDELPIHEGRYVKLVIKDQGVGIAEKILPRIFEPYFTTKHKGSGLGLATSYSIVKNHEGLITVESEVGTGTTFHIYLPASEKGSRGVPVSEGPVPKGTGRVLLMDDDESIRDLGREMLTSLGYAVELARNGAEAIEAYQTAQDHSNPFDVVILDLTVPGDMGGSETIGQLRTIDPDVRAIVSSGYSNDPVLADYEEYGFCDVVSKPYTIRELGDALRRVLAQNT
jgi:CheY-like chemotaxis protein